MKLSRMLAVGAATALVAVSTLVVGGAASAANFSVDATDPASGWGVDGTVTNSPTGLVLGSVGAAVYHANAATDVLTTRLAEASFTASGDAAFFVGVLTDEGDPATITELTADVSGTAGLAAAATWTTSEAFGSLAAGSSNTIADYEAELVVLATTLDILGYGVFEPTATSTVESITWAGDTHFFLPSATASFSPNPITVAAFSNASAGVVMSFTGFLPGEDILVGVNGPNFGGLLATLTADSNGAATYTYVEATSPDVGTYEIRATGDTSRAQIDSTFVVIANPAQLAATGADFTPAIVSGTLLLLLGAGFVLAGRRRAAAHRN